jgi:hypothetical protein
MGSIPEYPEYARVDSGVRENIIEHTAKYPPYSEFNYVNISSWDLNDSARVSVLNGNLVICLPDYMDGTEFYSFLGDNEACSTASTLLDEAELNSATRELRLVPEIGASVLESSGLFNVAEDPDGHDYVLSLAEVAAKRGSKFRNMRHEISIFSNRHIGDTVFKDLDVTDLIVQSQIAEVFKGRENLKTEGGHSNDSQSETQALGRLFELTDLCPLDAYGLEISGELRAFIICEKISADWYLGHFWKADTAYRGIYRYLMHQVADRLSGQGYLSMNIEQDLGIAGLRLTKSLFNPSGRLKKYTVTDKL